MKTLLVKNSGETIKLFYRTDLNNATDNQFTILGVEGVNQAAIDAGFPTTQMSTDLKSLKDIAASNACVLTFYDEGTPGYVAPVVQTTSTTTTAAPTTTTTTSGG